MNKWLNIIQGIGVDCLPLPCQCVLCLHPSRRNIALCQLCETTLPFLTTHCLLCALPLTTQNRLCGQCLIVRPQYKQLHALFDYAWPVNVFIAKFKYGGHLHFAKMLGSLMSLYLRFESPIDCIVPIPLHPARQCMRGFNQTIELASVVAKKQRLPLDRWSCTKLANTQQQSSLSAKARSRNIAAHTFAIHPRLRAKRVLVIEDVVTTGATVNAFTSALMHAGVATVEIWSCCRTAP